MQKPQGSKLYTLPAGLILLLASCSSVTESLICSTEARAGITVDVRDSVTDARVGRGARVIARAGAMADTTDETGFSDGPYGLAYERAGTYVVTVEQTGYARWTRNDVQVTNGDCHVNGVTLVARLQR